MKKQITTLALFAIIGLNGVFAQTSVPGGAVSGHWTVSGSPYNIMGSVYIPTLTTLTIDPGVTVSFQTSFGLTMIVQGRLLALGSVGDTITFTAANTTVGFGGIRFADSYKFTGNNSSKLEYCKIQYGKATGNTYLSANGGALLFCNWSNAIVSHSLISNCEASDGNDYSQGGAIFCDSSSNIIITNNTISYNSASEGGGICVSNSSPIISYNTISYNTMIGNGNADLGGGILFANSTNTTVSHNIITNNNMQYYGGIGVYFCNLPSISNNTISYNTGTESGGGIGTWGATIGVISDNIITYNSGGGIESGNSIDSIYNNIISNNSSSGAGAGIYLAGYCGYISNTTVTNNSAIGTTNNGGGLYFSGSSPYMLNVTIVNNYAGQYGGGLFCDAASKPSLYNCILWGDTAAVSGGGGGNEMFQNDANSAASFYYSDVQGGEAAFGLGPNFYTGTYANNINSVPMFVSPSGAAGYLYSGVSANWGLQNGSPCIDAGDPLDPFAPYSVYPSTDMAGNPRINICRIDMGAYENQYGISAPLNVGISGSDSICPHSSTTLTATGATTYTWSPSTGLSFTNIAAPVAKPKVTTTYTVIGTSGVCEAIDTIRVTVKSAADTSVTVSADSLTANATSATYQWLNCPAMTHIIGATNQSYTATANGNYAVIVTQNACSDTSACYTISTVGITESSLPSAIRIFPNPVTDNLQIQTTMQIREITVTDITGSLLLSTTSKTIDCNSFANGIYFIRVTTEKGVIVKQFIKE
jgi:hypothetical protein